MKTRFPVSPESLIDLLLDAICLVNREGDFLYVSAAGERIFGYRPEEMIGRPVLDFVHPDDRGRTVEAIDEILDGIHKPCFENRYVRKDGSTVHIMWSARWSDAGQIRVAVARDITERRHAEAKQAALYAISEAANASGDLQQLFRHVGELVKQLLPAAELEITLNDQESTIASPESELDPESAGHLRLPLQFGNDVLGTLFLRGRSGSAHFDARDRDLLEYIAEQLAAAIERKHMQARLQYLALHDPLTGLPNRALFLDHLQAALARARRNRTRIAVLYLDLDRFKQVNDHHGHAAGDHMLREVARRLSACIRESDVVGRLGGDEFVVLLDGIREAGCASVVEGKITAALAASCEFAGIPLPMTPSIGAAVYPEDGEGVDDLIHHADKAMYRAKRRRY